MVRAVLGLNILACSGQELASSGSGWNTVETSGVTPNGKDEAGYFEWEGALCMIGGRNNQPIDCFHPATSQWTRAKTYTDDLHHIQPVIWRDEVWIVAGWHGAWPDHERNIENVLVYNPKQDSMRTSWAIPEEFRRGGAGCVVYNDKIYIAQGASDGHLAQFGAKAFSGFSSLDPATGEWKALEAVPKYNRDHFDAALVGSKMVLTSGRDSPRGCTPAGSEIDCSGKPNIFHYTVDKTEIFDLEGDGSWHESSSSIPTERAGAMVLVDQQNRVVVLGGESDTQQQAFKSVEAYDVEKDEWTVLPSMVTGRHTGGAELVEENGKATMIAVIGVGNMGGGPQLQDTEEWQQDVVV